MFREMRRFKQQVENQECVEILKNEKRGVLSVIGDEGYPYTVPMDFLYEEEENTVYFHCAKEGHKIDSIRNCAKVCFTTWNTGFQKDGDWAWNVTSVVVFGHAELVEDDKLTYDKTRKIGLKYYPTTEEVDEEMERDISRVQLVALHIDHMTGKLVNEK